MVNYFQMDGEHKENVVRGDKQSKSLFGVLITLSLIILGLVCCNIVVHVIKNNNDTLLVELEDVVISGEADSELLDQYIIKKDEQINKTKGSKEKAALYSEKAGYISIYADKWNNDELKTLVLSDAYKAEELNPTIETAYDIYFYEREFGDKEKSDYYYKLSTERGLKNEGKG